MRITIAFFLLMITALGSLPAQETGGVSAEWNTLENIAAMSSRISEVKPILDQLKPEQWMEKGAPEAYKTQLDSTRVELEGIVWSLGNLASQPEKLSFAVDAYFRVQSFRLKVGSINEAVRRYQNPAIAELLEAYLVDSSGSQIQLQTYLQDLAALKEAELEVMASEAQRCRVQQIQRRPGDR